MKTRPRYQMVDTLAELGVAIGDPCAMLVENDHAFSVLFARHISFADTSRTPLRAERRVGLEGVFQLRIESDQRKIFRRFESVDVYKMDDFWVAEVSGSGNVFAFPSVDPYRVIFLSHELYGSLRSDAFLGRSDRIFMFVRDRFGMLPGFFSPSPTELITPNNYACANVSFEELTIDL